MTALVTAWRLDGKGGGEELDETSLPDKTDPGNIWLHLDRKEKGGRALAKQVADIPLIALDAVFADDTRPRCEDFQNGTLINLRGVNLNPNANPEDMASIRMWVTDHRVVSVRRVPLMTVQDIRARLGDPAAKGPKTVGQLVVQIIQGLTERLGPVIEALDERIDTIEDDEQALHRDLRKLSKEIISLRRYVAPQLGALTRLMSLQHDWLTPSDRSLLIQAVDDVTRYLEELNHIKERTDIAREALNYRASERMNRTMYILSLVAGLFLPLSFVTGLLGINVGGMPGMDSGDAFWIVCVILVVIGVIEWFIFKRYRL